MADSSKRAPSGSAMFEHACGRTIRAWASIEFMLLLYLMAFLKIEDQFRARIIWASLPNLSDRRKLLNRLAETYLDESALPIFQKLMKRVSRLAQKRNLIAHAMGNVYENGKVLFVFDDDSDEDGFNFVGGREFDLTNVLNWPSDVDRLSSDLYTFLVVIDPLVHTSAKMHRVPQDGRAPHSDPHPGESNREEPPPRPEPSPG